MQDFFSGGSDGSRYEDGYLCDQLRQHPLLQIKWLTNYLIPSGKAAFYVGLATECCTHLNKDEAGDDGITSLGIVS